MLALMLQKTLQGLNQRFKEAMKVMTWLNDVAYSVAKTGEVVTWDTPLGLPVVQPYRKLVSESVCQCTCTEPQIEDSTC